MMTHCFLNPCMSVLAMRNVRLVSDFGTHVDESLLPHCGKVEPEQNVESVYSPQTAARHAQEAAGAQSHSKAADTLHNKLLQLVQLMTPSVVYRPIFTHSTHPSFAGPWARKRHPSHQKKHEYPDAQQSV